MRKMTKREIVQRNNYIKTLPTYYLEKCIMDRRPEFDIGEEGRMLYRAELASRKVSK